MVGPLRPQIVLFGSSIVQLSFDNGGWGAILANLYARKVILFLLHLFNSPFSAHAHILLLIIVFSTKGLDSTYYTKHKD